MRAGGKREVLVFCKGHIDSTDGWTGCSTHIGPLGRHVLIILPRIRRLGALLPNHPKLLPRQHGLPFVLALLDGVVRHVFLRLAAAAEEGAQKGDAGHGAEESGAVGEGGVGEAVE